MMLGARTAALAKSGYTAKDYEQYGLVATWDGIENAGWGQHDPNATVWRDLIGSRNLPLNSGTFGWSENSLIANGSGNVCYVTNFQGFGFSPNEPTYSYEGCFLCSKNNGWVFSFGVDGTSIGSTAYGFAYFNRNDLLARNGWSERGWSTDLSTKSLVGTNAYENLILTSRNNYYADNKNQRIFWLFGNGISGFAHSFRVYNRVLSFDELKNNYAIDKARFNLP